MELVKSKIIGTVTEEQPADLSWLKKCFWLTVHKPSNYQVDSHFERKEYRNLKINFDNLSANSPNCLRKKPNTQSTWLLSVTIVQCCYCCKIIIQS